MDDADTDAGAAFDWDAAAATAGATGKQKAFAMALAEGCSQAGAAKKAGYSGTPEQLRTVGSRTAQSKAVVRLLAFAKAAGVGATGSVASLHECQVEMSELMRHGAQSARVAAARALQDLKRLEAEERARDQADSPEAVMRLMIACAGPEGLLAAAGVYIRQHGTLVGFPLAAETLPVLKGTYPEAWARLYGKLPPQHRDDIAKLASGPVHSLDEIAPPETRRDFANGSGEPEASADTPATPGAEATQHAVIDRANAPA